MLVPFTKLDGAAFWKAVIITFIALELQILGIKEREIRERDFTVQNQARHWGLVF